MHGAVLSSPKSGLLENPFQSDSAAACADDSYANVVNWPGRWAVAVALNPRHLLRTVEIIQAYEVPCFVPRVYVTTWIEGKRRVESRPLFPGGYFFPCYPSDAHLPSRLSDWQIAQLIRPPECSQTKLKSEIVTIQNAISANPFTQLHGGMEVGTAVRIIEGPYRGMEGIFESIGKQDRVYIRLEIMGDSIPVDVSSGQVEPI